LLLRRGTEKGGSKDEETANKGRKRKGIGRDNVKDCRKKKEETVGILGGHRALCSPKWAIRTTRLQLVCDVLRAGRDVIDQCRLPFASSHNASPACLACMPICHLALF